MTPCVTFRDFSEYLLDIHSVPHRVLDGAFGEGEGEWVAVQEDIVFAAEFLTVTAVGTSISTRGCEFLLFSWRRIIGFGEIATTRPRHVNTSETPMVT